MAIVEGNDAEDDDQFRRNHRLDHAQAPDPQCRNLEHEAEDHAEDSKKPDGPTEEVAHQMQVETELSGCGSRRPPLRHRGHRREPTRRQGQEDDLKCHACTSVPVGWWFALKPLLEFPKPHTC